MSGHGHGNVSDAAVQPVSDSDEDEVAGYHAVSAAVGRYRPDRRRRRLRTTPLFSIHPHQVTENLQS